MPHYTSTSQDAFIERVTADFIGQIAQRLENSKTSQGELAEKLGVTDSEVSQVLNLNRTNLKLATMVRYARALGMKVAVVAYDDGDPTNQRGPVGANIFSLTWEKTGRPRNLWSVNELTRANEKYLYALGGWKIGSMTSTMSDVGKVSGTTGQFLHITDWQLVGSGEATSHYGRSKELRF